VIVEGAKMYFPQILINLVILFVDAIITTIIPIINKNIIMLVKTTTMLMIMITRAK
jgi:hypothetical protein